MHRQQMDESIEEGPSKCSTFIYYTWKICSCIFSHVMLVSMVVSYCIAGAYTFEALEKQNEIDVRKNISLIRNNVTRDIWCLTKGSDVLHEENWTRTVKEELKKFERVLLTSMKSDGWDGEDDDSVQWNFTGALFYSIIVITTIGYGHIAPKTHWGKIVTIFYAILGIPLMLLCLSNIGDIMAHSFRFLYWRVCCYVCTKKPKRPQLKRGRSVRGSVRQPGGAGQGRGSWRSGSSFRRSARASQRSADSALGLSEAMTYSDNGEYGRGYREDDLQGINRGRFSQHSRFSDTVLVAGRRPPSTLPLSAVQDSPLDLAPGAPVLFNKYAIELEGSQRDRSGLKSGLDPANRQQHLDIPPAPPSLSSSPLRRPAQRECRARIMSPMGFAISRQGSRGPRDYPEWEAGTDFDYDDSSSGQRSRTKPVPIWLCVFLVVNYIFCGAFMFSKWEQWNFLDSIYFCFITLTTIGFGDLVPAQGVKQSDDVKMRIALCSLYLLFGIALLAMSFNLVQEEVINNVKSVAKRLGIIKSDEEEEEEE